MAFFKIAIFLRGKLDLNSDWFPKDPITSETLPFGMKLAMPRISVI